MSPEKTIIGIFDDHPLTGSGIKAQLQQHGYSISCCCNDRHTLLEHLTRTEVHILVLDVLSPDTTGIELFEETGRRYPQIKMIAYTSLGSRMLVDSLLRSGVCGYVNKLQQGDDLITAVKTVMTGKIYLPAEYSDLLNDQQPDDNIRHISKREAEVLKLIAQQYNSRQIAEKLFISENTVENHRRSLFSKLKVTNLAGLIMVAFKNGYISHH